MNNWIIPVFLSLFLSANLQIRLSHDNKKGYAYTISGPALEEVIETDQKMRQYLRSQSAPKKKGPGPSTSGPKPGTIKK